MRNSDGQQRRGYETDRELEFLQEYEQERRKPGQLPGELKVCIMVLLRDEKRLREGVNSFYAAVEMDRLGVSEQQIVNRLDRLGVPLSKAQNSAKSAATHRYSRTGCKKFRDELDLCLYSTFEECPWYRKIIRGRYKAKEKDFERFGWFGRLTNIETKLYFAMKAIEEKRAYAPGSRVFASRKQLSEVSGISERRLLTYCERLHQKGLIRFRKGRQGTHHHQASEFNRVWPIPKPETEGKCPHLNGTNVPT